MEQTLAPMIGIDRWQGLIAGLDDLNHASYPTVRDRVLELLLIDWKPRPVMTAFPGGQAEGATLAASAEPTPLARWVEHAEDLLALMFMRWVVVSLSQIWTLTGFLVAASLALLLAVNAYPFPYQDRMMLGLGILIAGLAATIMIIVVGFNRDEMVSRISKTAPNRLEIDGNLIGGLLTYILPLLGIFAALSFDTSDTLHSLLDPILRRLR
jgi:hypothetical protein